MAVTTYNPRKVTCSFGTHMVSGFADDSFISIEADGDGTSYVIGADGAMVRSIDPSNVYKITLTLLQTSQTNDYLMARWEQDHTEGDGTFSVSISDVLGDERFSSAVAWVTKPATWERGKEQSNREWEIVVADGVFS